MPTAPCRAALVGPALGGARIGSLPGTKARGPFELRQLSRTLDRLPSAPGFEADNVVQLLAHYFADEDLGTGMNSLDAFDVLSHGLRVSTPAHTPQVRRFLGGFVDMLRNARALSAAVQASRPTLDGRLVDDHILSPLAAGRPVLFEGGYAQRSSGHYAAVLILPADRRGKSICVVLNRGEGASRYHVSDRIGRPKPFIFEVDTAALFGRAGHRILTQLQGMQRDRRGNSIQQFYTAVSRLTTLDGGLMLLGKLHGTTFTRVDAPAQKEQKGGTCTLHGNLNLLQFCLNDYFGTVQLRPGDPLPDSRAKLEVHLLYKRIKNDLRLVVAHQAMKVAREAVQAGDVDLAEELLPELERVLQWLRDRRGTAKDLRGELGQLHRELEAFLASQPPVL